MARGLDRPEEGNSRRVGRRTRGAALVEMALVLPLLTLITIGIFTSARAWNIHNVLDHASREAARYGATDPTDSEVESVARGVVTSAGFSWDRVNYCFDFGSAALGCIPQGTGNNEDPTTDSRVQVTLVVPDYELNFVFFRPKVDLRAQAVARLEP